jgi:hypothetical protein
MGFKLEINGILRSDEYTSLVEGQEYPFHKDGSRLFFDDIAIWLTKNDWTALAEIKVTTQTRTETGVEGSFKVLHIYSSAEQATITNIFKRMYGWH